MRKIHERSFDINSTFDFNGYKGKYTTLFSGITGPATPNHVDVPYYSHRDYGAGGHTNCYRRYKVFY